jgi:hypothetical protein
MGRKERSRLKFTSFHLFGNGIMFYIAMSVRARVRTITAGPMCPNEETQNASQHQQEQAKLHND